MNDDKNNKEGIDLSGSLRDDSGTGVKFQEYRVERSYYPGTPKIIQLVIKYSGGLIKDEKQASYAILAVVAITFLLTFLFLRASGLISTKSEPSVPIEQQLETYRTIQPF